MTFPHLPLERFPLIHTRSFDEALSIQSDISASPMRGELRDRRVPFEWRANGFAVGAVGITAGQYGAGFSGGADCLQTQYSLSLPISGRGLASQHHTSASVVPGHGAALGSPGLPAHIAIESGYQGLQVVVPAQVMEEALDALTGVQRRAPLRFNLQVELDQAPGASVVRLLDFIVGEAEQEGSVLHTPLIAAKLAETFVYSLLVGLPHNHTRLVHSVAPKADPLCLRRAEEYIAANAHGPITLRSLSAAAGVSAAALFAAFRSHRGCSPMAFVRDRRFELSRLRMLGSSATTVAEVAVSCGFEHLGRFSLGYRKRFGESPKDTLRRARSCGK